MATHEDRFAALEEDYELWLECDPNYLPLQDAVGRVVRAHCSTLSDEKIYIVEGGVGTGLTSECLLLADERIRLIGLEHNSVFATRTQEGLVTQFPDRVIRIDNTDFVTGLKRYAGIKVVVSALTVHNLSPKDRKELLDTVRMSMSRGGLFVLGDKIIPDNLLTYGELLESWVAQLDFFKHINRPDLYDRWLQHEKEDQRNPLRESDLIALLTLNGFTDIRIVGRFGMYAVVTAFMS